MKKSLLMMAAVPALSLGAGYGIGMVMKPKPAEAALSVEDDSHAAPAGHGESPAKAEPGVHGKVEDTGHEALRAAEDHADAGEMMDHGKPRQPSLSKARVVTDPKVVALGKMTIPVYKPASVTYVVADFGVAMTDPQMATEYRIAENATRLRDAILTSMMSAAQDPILAGSAIDSEKLAARLKEDLQPQFASVEDVLFLTLFKQDVPRS
ncbi:hypothetical protein [Pseudooceanicola nanhaiensis]|uniref:hypothetical protein n=1 Tax=Pseudooceanicola nanhaiensis TaxID=375761 RepID=UPI001CD50767|nr:hypothetical protein [Pseudooceanicola nanhaiensis]MCA0922614.1 hypothetical protein [Pseudooceanicola nanhaiensis]